MQNYDLKSLNNEQMQALMQTEGAVLVTAGAGSGKTRLLTHRIAYLIKEKHVVPHKILAITFTNKAANEMLERTNSMLGGVVSPWISTFHSMCAKMLRKDIDKIGYKSSFSIYSDSDTDKLLDQILTSKHLDENKKDFKKTISFHISNCKNNNMSLEEYRQNFNQVPDINIVMEVFEAYQKRLFDANALDFDDLLTKTYQLFASCQSVREYYQNRFEYILVDEFQDTNIVQYELVKMLALKHKNIFVVGDEDQCIYTWRGASYENIFRFRKDFDVKLFKLETNYRSTPNILSYANALITHNSSRIEKVLKSVKGQGIEPEVHEAYDEQEEANYVVKKIAYLTEQKGYNYNDFAILMRVNALSFAFEQALLSYNMPYRVYGGYKFYERVEIKNVLSYLKLFVNPQDEVALLRIINFPKRGIGEGAIAKLQNLAFQNRQPLLDIVLNFEQYDLPSSLKSKLSAFEQIYKSLLADYETMPLDEFCSQVVTRFDVKSAYNSQIDEELYKQMNIDTLITSIADYSKNNESNGLGQYLESVTLMNDIDTMDSSNNVTLATVHSVKGLEFPVVFVIGCEESLFPISRAFNSGAEMEEERRLMYVAITRAENYLFITHSTSRYMYGQRKYSVPSRFLREVGYKPKLKTPVIEHEVHVSSFANKLSDITKQVFAKPEQKTEKDISCYKVGQVVTHTRYGVGKIIAIVGQDADIVFDSVGKKTLILTLAPLEIME